MAIEDSHLDRIAKVVEDLRFKGFQVTRSRPELGIVSGSVPGTELSPFAKVAGVLAVEPDGEVEIASKPRVADTAD